MRKYIVIILAAMLMALPVAAQESKVGLPNTPPAQPPSTRPPTHHKPTKPSKVRPTAVDLGLSVKWASFNVGATSPEDYGDYFAWGETKPKSTYTKENYQWNGVSDGILKVKGVIDGNGNLTPKYDAARANWGGNWRMPTLEEVIEFRDKCEWSWTTLDGVQGCVVTGPSGNAIFLPASGFYSTTLIRGGELFSIWNSELWTTRLTGIYCEAEGLHKETIGFDNYFGLTIRPVTE